jgi:hypothetical protein
VGRAAVWTPTLGTNSGVAASVTSGIGTFVSGAVGSNATQDKIWSTFSARPAPVPTSTRRGGLRTSRSRWVLERRLLGAVLLATPFVSLSTTMTHFLQFQMNAVGIRVGYKAGGSFTKLSETGNANLTYLGTSTDANGQIHYSATQTTDGAHYYGVGFEALLIDGSGNQTINVYSGTEAQADLGFGGSGMPLIATILVPQAVRSLDPRRLLRVAEARHPVGDGRGADDPVQGSEHDEDHRPVAEGFLTWLSLSRYAIGAQQPGGVQSYT